MKKKTERSKLREKLDKAWKDAVKFNAGWKCEYCGANKDSVQLHSHHIFGKRKLSTRWDLENGACLCASHHKLSSDFSAHETPTEFTFWLIEGRGQARYDELRLKANQHYKFSLEELESMLEELE